MTKFEEEVKRPDNGPVTELNNNMQQVFSQYRKMRQYADYLEYELKQKDEHILKVENENSFMRDERTTFDSNGNSVEPIIPQQALPVVPECVAEAIEKDKQANVSISDVFEATFSYENHHLTEAGLWTKNNPEQYIVARNIGYTVEKPQLFYLKNKLTGLYLACDAEGYLETGRTVAEKFTQQEIDSMQTGSYEQIPVPGEDGE